MAGKKTTQQLAQESPAAVLDYLQTSRQGLTAQQAAARLKKYGPNQIVKSSHQSQLKIFLKNFVSLMAIL